MTNVVSFPGKPAMDVSRSIVRIEMHRDPIAQALDWQTAIIDLRRRHPFFGAAFVADLKASGLQDRCLFLASDRRDGPLVMKFIGMPTVDAFGRAWARQQLGKPLTADPHQECAADAECIYREAIEGGPIFNRCRLSGLSCGAVPFSHVVVGWTARDGRRAVLSAIAA